jgi:hypothetical protein
LREKICFLDLLRQEGAASPDGVIDLLEILEVDVSESDVRVALQSVGWTQSTFAYLYEHSERFHL